MRGLGEGARAIIETDTLGIYAPVFCDGEKWVMEEKLGLSDCKVCVACQDGSRWHLVSCNDASDDGWTGMESRGSRCFDSWGKLAVKFVCGKDSYRDDKPSDRRIQTR